MYFADLTVCLIVASHIKADKKHSVSSCTEQCRVGSKYYKLFFKHKTKQTNDGNLLPANAQCKIL